MRSLLLHTAVFCTAAACLSCSRAEQQRLEKIRVFVSILPQKYFVERVGGGRVDAEVLVGPGRSPATYEPTPRQMAKLNDAQLLFLIGVPFEKAFVSRLASTFENLKVVDTRKGITLRYMAEPDDFDHEHAEGFPDPHIWLDPKLVKIQAQTMCDALGEIDPDHRKDYARNLKSFHTDLDSVDGRIAEALAPLKGRTLFVFHPAFGYFADAYGLKQVAVETGGKEPSAKQLAALIERARREDARVIFVQRQFSGKAAASVAEAIGAVVVSVDPLAYDYLGNLEEMAEKIQAGLGSGEHS